MLLGLLIVQTGHAQESDDCPYPKKRKIQALAGALKAHGEWLEKSGWRNPEVPGRANFCNADLSGAKLEGARLFGANLEGAHQSGAHAWDNDKRRQYTNDLDNPGHLIGVDDGTNQSKGFKDPAEWLPPNENFHCAYVMAWVEVKRVWQLSVDADEAEVIRDVLAGCDE